jgi:acetate kinase
MRVLACDAGSTSFKAALYELHGDPPGRAPQPVWSGTAQRDSGALRLVHARGGGRRIESLISQAEDVEAAERLLDTCSMPGGPAMRIDVAVHRVVHGGLVPPVRLTPERRKMLSLTDPIDAAHNAATLQALHAVDDRFDVGVHLAVSDSAFHATLPPRAYTFAVPHEWEKKFGIRRLGYHGISHEYVSGRCAVRLGPGGDKARIVTCHLGGGCSLAAVEGGRSVDTTMGMTTIDGLVMAQRCGALDPGVVLRLLLARAFNVKGLASALLSESGLKGISGLTGDMRTINAARLAGNQQAALAFDVYVHQLCAGVAAMAASMNGLDALVFTGGVGENSREVRESVGRALEFLGVHLDSEANAATAHDERDIGRSGAAVRTMVIPTDECWGMARKAYTFAG